MGGCPCTLCATSAATRTYCVLVRVNKKRKKKVLNWSDILCHIAQIRRKLEKTEISFFGENSDVIAPLSFHDRRCAGEIKFDV